MAFAAHHACTHGDTVFREVGNGGVHDTQVLDDSLEGAAEESGLGLVRHVDGEVLHDVALAVEGALELDDRASVVAVGADGREVLDFGHVDVGGEGALDGVLSAVHLLGEPDQVVGSAQLVYAVHLLGFFTVGELVVYRGLQILHALFGLGLGEVLVGIVAFIFGIQGFKLLPQCRVVRLVVEGGLGFLQGLHHLQIGGLAVEYLVEEVAYLADEGILGGVVACALGLGYGLCQLGLQLAVERGGLGVGDRGDVVVADVCGSGGHVAQHLVECFGGLVHRTAVVEACVAQEGVELAAECALVLDAHGQLAVGHVGQDAVVIVSHAEGDAHTLQVGASPQLGAVFVEGTVLFAKPFLVGPSGFNLLGLEQAGELGVYIIGHAVGIDVADVVVL